MKYERTIVVTGGLGFIGSAFLRRYVAEYPNYFFVNIDDHRAGSNEASVAELEGRMNYQFVKAPLESPELIAMILSEIEATDVIHFAAESDVDTSIREPYSAIISNVASTVSLLEAVKKLKEKGAFNRFLYVSTDEVYGPIASPGSYSEDDRTNPMNPYSASKLACEHICKSYANTYGIDVVITRGANTFGPWQAATKLIPRSVALLKAGQQIELYDNGEAVREWIPVYKHISGVFKAWSNGVSGEVYNISTGIELNGIEVASILLETLLPNRTDAMVKFTKGRPGHDMRYSVNAQKIRDIGWRPDGFLIKEVTKKAIAKTAQWYWNKPDSIVK